MIKTKFASAVATGALLFSMATPAFAETIQITGNGAGSFNTTTVSETNNTAVSQNNNASVSNTVSSNSDSGNNSANFNTGGNTQVSSGAATSTTNVSTAVNANSAQVSPCGNCAGGNADVTISGNGAGSFNNANVTESNDTTVGQNNSAYVSNNVQSNANSGGNDAGFNTGGNVTVNAGPATAISNVSTVANKNVANVGGNSGVAGAGSSASALISGNGAGSFNTIALNLPSSVSVGQNNSASISNNVDSNANSGNNNANFNTNGDVLVMSGPALAKTNVDNLANFNSADLSCGCLTSGVNAKIAGNGAGATFSNINATLAKFTALGQNNGVELNNNNDANAASGYNESGWNTGAVSGISDPAVLAGGSTSQTSVSNLANWNSAGVGTTVSLPGGTNLNLLFSLSSLLGLLH